MSVPQVKDDKAGIGCTDAKEVAKCCNCESPIFPGEEYGVIYGKAYCQECLDVMPMCVLIPLCGGEWKTPGEKE